eukprot:4796356-Alexandrium_andersonii.AAC.1
MALPLPGRGASMCGGNAPSAEVPAQALQSTIRHDSSTRWLLGFMGVDLCAHRQRLSSGASDRVSSRQPLSSRTDASALNRERKRERERERERA